MTMFLFNQHEHRQDSNITKVTSGVILHGCNAQGVMGSGVAKQLRAKYPDIYLDYVHGISVASSNKENPLGQVYFSWVTPDLYIANAVTQEFYGRDGRQYVDYLALEQAVSKTVDFADRKNLPVHVPYLIGAGLGGGSEKIILDIFAKYQYNIIFHYWK
jgi:O-acetyl-ADP-ribose deacetylase (regulator of RNase III)